MATKTVTAMFDRYSDAAQAVSKLEAAGVNHSDISIVSNDASQRDAYSTTSTGSTMGGSSTTGHDHDAKETGAGTGASVGTLVGGGAGLLAGLGLLAIPGLGPVVAAGWLAATLVGAGAGAATGGLIGTLAGAGIDEKDAHSYAEAIQRGGTLVTVRTDDNHYSRVVDILDDEGTVDMNDRETSWRSEGWSGQYKEGSDSVLGNAGAQIAGAAGAAASAVGLGHSGSGHSGSGMGTSGSGTSGMGAGTGSSGMGSGSGGMGSGSGLGSGSGTGSGGGMGSGMGSAAAWARAATWARARAEPEQAAPARLPATAAVFGPTPSRTSPLAVKSP
jgi:hypothetical protein